MLISTRKSQVEIVGLIVIVLLLIVAMIFILQFTISRPYTVQTYVHKQIANNMVSSLLETSTVCDKDVADLLQDCVDHPESASRIFCLDKDSCEFVNDTIENILDKTLRKWKKQFILTATVSNPYEAIINTSSYSLSPICRGERRTAKYLLQTETRGTMIINMFICD